MSNPSKKEGLDGMRAERVRKTTVLCCMLALLVSCGVNGNRGTGEKIGQVVKLSRQGIMQTTWEGQLIRGGMNGGSGAFGTVPFDFTVEDESLVAKLQGYMENQTEVLIHYRAEGIYSLWRSDSGGHFLVSVEPARKETPMSVP